jgi:hypothetical protein
MSHNTSLLEDSAVWSLRLLTESGASLNGIILRINVQKIQSLRWLFVNGLYSSYWLAMTLVLAFPQSKMKSSATMIA